MTVSAKLSSLTCLAKAEGRTVWAYRSSEHILEVMARSDYFHKSISRFSAGDIILVDCPGYFSIERLLGNPPQAVHRAGGGILQVEAGGETGQLQIRIVGRGLRRLVNSGKDGMSAPGIFPHPMEAGLPSLNSAESA